MVDPFQWHIHARRPSNVQPFSKERTPRALHERGFQTAPCWDPVQTDPVWAEDNVWAHEEDWANPYSIVSGNKAGAPKHGALTCTVEGGLI